MKKDITFGDECEIHALRRRMIEDEVDRLENDTNGLWLSIKHHDDDGGAEITQALWLALSNIKARYSKRTPAWREDIHPYVNAQYRSVLRLIAQQNIPIELAEERWQEQQEPDVDP